VHRTTRAGLRLTRAQRRRVLSLLAAAGDVWSCMLELNTWRRVLVPVRWYHGRFVLDGRRLRLPVAAGCPPLWVRLDRDLPCRAPAPGQRGSRRWRHLQLGSRRNGAGYDSSGRQLTDRRWIYEYDAWAEAAALASTMRPAW
jgi:hypothetical protein